MEHKGTKILETQRLLLRHITLDDTDAMFNNWASDEVVTRYVMWNAHKDTEATKDLYCVVLMLIKILIATNGVLEIRLQKK